MNALTAADARAARAVRDAEAWAKTVVLNRAVGGDWRAAAGMLGAAVRVWRAVDRPGFDHYMARLEARKAAK